MKEDRPDSIWFQTDDAWDFLPLETRAGLKTVAVREEARGLRFITSNSKIDAFAAMHGMEFRPYTLFGSGDFHHLSAVWTRQFTEPFSILSFDNHPDWDVRPPRWSCGAWVNRALENPRVQSVSVWGCDSFECNLPGRLLGNRAAAKAGKLLVHPWRREGSAYPAWLQPIAPENWRSKFGQWLAKIKGLNVYVTIDIDCLIAEQAFTNWEHGRYTGDDLVWALSEVRSHAHIIGGDLCGAWSTPSYQTRFQKLAGWFDHPHVPAPNAEELRKRHLHVWQQLWPALVG